MRFQDPTKRTQWLGTEYPAWMQSMGDKAASGASSASRNMGEIDRLRNMQQAQRAETARIHSDPLLSSAERAEKLAGIRATREETNSKLRGAEAAQRTIQADIAKAESAKAAEKATKGHTAALQGNARLFQGARQSVVGMGAGGLGVLRDGGSALMKSPAAAPMGSMLAMSVLGMTGSESKMANLGAMGLMFGPKGAAVGAGVGAVMDMAAVNDKVDNLSKATAEVINQTEASGGISINDAWDTYQKELEGIKAYKADISTTNEELGKTQGLIWGFGHVGDVWSSTKNTVEGWVGSSDVEEQQAAADKNKEQYDLLIEAAQSLADISGEKFTGTDSNQRQQISDFMSGEGAQAMARGGYAYDDLLSAIKADDGSENDLKALEKKYADEKPDWQSWEQFFVSKSYDPGVSSGGSVRLGETVLGKAMKGSDIAQDSIRLQGDVNLFYQATSSVFTALREQGLSYADIVGQSRKGAEAYGVENSRQFEIASAVNSKARQMMAIQAPYQSRVEQIQSQTSLYENIVQTAPSTAAGREEKEVAEAQFMQFQNEQGDYFRNLLYQHREYMVQKERSEEDFALQQERMAYQFGLSQSRAQEDFAQQRAWSEADYNLSRERAQIDYDLSRERSQKQFNLSMSRADTDFNIQRKRQEKDFAHTKVLMAEQAAKSIYDVYERVPVNNTSAASFTLLNSRDQTERMQRQASQLDKLRGMGVKDDTIQQLGLTDSANAQQLTRFVAEIASDPSLVKKFNKEVSERLKAAAALTRDESSTEWQEMERNYNLARRRAGADFQRQIRRAHDDFNTQMKYMAKDFDKSMNRMSEDYETAMERNSIQFHKSMKRAGQDYKTTVDNMNEDYDTAMTRAAKDLERMTHEIDGDLFTLIEKATNKFGGHVDKVGEAVISSLKNLKGAAAREGVETMKELSKVFGFKYDTPGWYDKGWSGPGMKGSQDPEDRMYGKGMATGGVLPGYTPGADVHHFRSPTAGDLHLSGGEAVMRPEWTNAVGPGFISEQNAIARAQGAEGVRRSLGFSLGGILPGARITGHTSTYYDHYARDFNVGSGYDDYGLPIHSYAKGFARAFDYGYDNSYGRGVVVDHGSYQTLYAHMSRVASVLGKVAEGQTIGYVGAYGNTGTPPSSHLHFEIGSGWSLPWTSDPGSSDGNYGSSAPGSRGRPIKIDRFLKDYPGLEKAASEVGNGKMVPPGHMTKVMHEMVRDKWDKLVDRYGTPYSGKNKKWAGDGGIFSGPQNIGIGERGPEAVLPLNERGADFLSTLISKHSSGKDARGLWTRGDSPVMVHNANTYHVNKSTNFTGAITVTANSPEELIAKLQARQRLSALSNAAQGGRRV
jgi:hypothetical protein